MGWIKKLLGTDNEDQPNQPDGPESVRLELVRMSSNGRVDVVGESNYQAALEAAAGASTDRGGEGIGVIAVLVPEQNNPYDPNAVRVDVGGATVGYLSRQNALRYRRPLEGLLREGQVGECPARMFGGGDHHWGIWLHVAEPEALFFANDAEDLNVSPAERIVTVTKRKPHTEFLEELLSGATTVTVIASLHLVSVDSGTHAGKGTIEVRVDGSRIGEFSRAKADAYLPMLSAIEAPGCEVTITRDDRGINALAHLAKVK